MLSVRGIYQNGRVEYCSPGGLFGRYLGVVFGEFSHHQLASALQQLRYGYGERNHLMDEMDITAPDSDSFC